MSNKYQQLIDEFSDHIGGTSNVKNILHCMTRLRISVNDKEKVNTEALKKLPGVLGTNWNGDQIQLIIGQNVSDVYEDVCRKYGFQAEAAIDENLDTADAKKKISVTSVIDYISGSVAPVIPVLVGCGLMKVIVTLLTTSGILAADSTTITILTFAGDAGFYFLPIMIGAFAARKLGANMGLGMLMGAILIHPTLISAVSEGTPLSLLGLPVRLTDYSSSVFPVLLSVAVMAPIQKFFGKHSPVAIRSIVEPLCTLIVMLPLALCLLAPIGGFIGNYISIALIWLYEHTGWVGITVASAVMQLLIATGMHTSLIPYLVNSFATLGFEPIVLTSMIISNVNEGAADLAVALKNKDPNVRSTAISCAITAVTSGIVEPSIYGITLKYKTPLIAVMLGSAIGGAVAGLTGTLCYGLSGSGLLGLASYAGPAGNLLKMAIAVAVGFAATFIITMVIYKPEEER